MGKKLLMIALILMLGTSLMGCFATTSTGQRWGEVGGVIGGVGGAVIDKDNPWRGGALGYGGGKILGEIMGDTAEQQEQQQQQQQQQQEPPRGYWRDILGHYDERGIWIEKHREWVPYQ